MASSSAVQDKSPFFHFRNNTKSKQNKSSSAAPADAFVASAATPKLNKLPKTKPQALAQGDESARKGGLLDCFGILGILALCCVCCQGSGNAGYGRRWATAPKNPQPNTGNAAV